MARDRERLAASMSSADHRPSNGVSRISGATVTIGRLQNAPFSGTAIAGVVGLAPEEPDSNSPRKWPGVLRTSRHETDAWI